MATTTAPLVKWKLKYILPNGVWLPLKTSNDIIVFGKNSSQRLTSAAKLVGGFKDPFDDAFIYEVGQNGQMIAKYDKDLRRFILK
ncbi:hypothetical protein [Flectobacillus major]|uniref:hypothetical protein n=1 Tax=Flectobacillus major TaxID=103 RepID=UPI0003FEDC37|nr:hypothetical protein [Flectobacillus major]